MKKDRIRNAFRFKDVIPTFMNLKVVSMFQASIVTISSATSAMMFKFAKQNVTFWCANINIWQSQF